MPPRYPNMWQLVPEVVWESTGYNGVLHRTYSKPGCHWRPQTVGRWITKNSWQKVAVQLSKFSPEMSWDGISVGGNMLAGMVFQTYRRNNNYKNGGKRSQKVEAGNCQYENQKSCQIQRCFQIQDGWAGESHTGLSYSRIWKEQRKDYASRSLTDGNFQWS